jgi:hypothetical protein
LHQSTITALEQWQKSSGIEAAEAAPTHNRFASSTLFKMCVNLSDEIFANWSDDRIKSRRATLSHQNLHVSLSLQI